jgi:hypothetical protein
MLTSEIVAIAAHLHVLLRRKTGRVTDTEWMASNLEYASEIVRFARANSVQEGHADLAEWAGKLERAILRPERAERTAAQRATPGLREQSVSAALPGTGFADSMSAGSGVEPIPQPSGFGPSTYAGESGFGESSFGGDPAKRRERRDPNAPRYVGGLR